MATYNQTSPYANTPTTRFYLGLYVDRPVPEHRDDRLITVPDKYEHRPDLLAYNLYGDTRLWWIFYRRNLDAIKDPIFGFTAGLQIIVPSKDHVTKVVS